MTDSNSSIQFYLKFDYDGKRYNYDVFRLDLNQSESGAQIYIQANPTEFELIQKAKYSSSDCFVFGIQNGQEIMRMSIKHFDIKEKTDLAEDAGMMYIQAVRSKLNFILSNALKENNLGEYIISNLEQSKFDPDYVHVDLSIKPNISFGRSKLKLELISY